MALWSEISDIISAFASQDSWEIRNALKSDGAWVFGAIATAIGGLAMLGVYKKLPWLDRHLERTIMVYSYLAIASSSFGASSTGSSFPISSPGRQPFRRCCS